MAYFINQTHVCILTIDVCFPLARFTKNDRVSSRKLNGLDQMESMRYYIVMYSVDKQQKHQLLYRILLSLAQRKAL